uniref:Uncharacterized protein n=1 Tax=Rhizophora mucronata TaxID=61149 RepID=A0A2P2NDZ2_RHIMU
MACSFVGISLEELFNNFTAKVFCDKALKASSCLFCSRQ